ncbi:MAG TPA: TraB/GumN family protein, partial [Brevundimonas sp.]
RGHIKIRAVDAGRGDELIENLLTAAPETFVPCMEAAIAATEAGPESLVARGEAWTKFRVPAVLASPLERALGVCWPWGDPSLGPQLKAEWVKAVNAGLGETGVTMAVAPLGVLAEPGGVLDQLEAQGLEIDGPVWREDQR